MVSSYIRQHHLGLVAIFIALTGTAYASNQLAPVHPTAKAAKVKRRARGPQGPPGPQGIPGPPGLLSGPASGDLTGNYPGPQIAAEAVGPAETGVVPAATARDNEATAVPSGTDTTLHFDGESFDTADMHDNVTNNERLTAPIAGVYLVQASIQWPISPNPDAGPGVRKIVLPGVLFGGTDVQIGLDSDTTVDNASAIVELLPGDEVHVVASQTSGATLTPAGSFSMVWLGPPAPA